MKIVSVCRVLPTPESPAAGAFVLRRLEAMSRQVPLRVIQPVPHLPLVRPLPAWACAESHVAGGVTIEHAPMFYVPGVLKSLDGRWLGRAIRGRISALKAASHADVVDAHFGYPDGVGCVRVARELGLPVFVTLRGMEVDALRTPRIREPLIEALKDATGCITVSHSLRDVAVEAGVDPRNILVAPNAVDRRLFRPGDRGAARARLGLSPSNRIVVSVGHLISGKRHAVVIQAIAALRAKWPDLRLVIIGGAGYEPDHPRELRTLVHDSGLDDVVRFAGAVSPDAVASWLQAADAFALGTEREGCCNAVLEALAVGLPVVTTPVGDNARFVTDDFSGKLVGVGDVAAMATALDLALSRRWDAEGISRELPVGTWPDVAAQVLGFMRSRMRTSAADTR